MAPRLQHFLLLAALLQVLAATSAATTGDVATGYGKVNVAVYYESLCPTSMSFVVNNLFRAYTDGLLDGADITLVPYGNAEVGGDGTVSCQHGPDECLLNTVEACAIDAWPDVKVHFGFINCVSDLVMKNKHQEWESCFQKQGLDPKPVLDCYNSEHGHNLLLQYGRQTDALVPPHQFVPWVVVDGKPLYNDYRNFETYICKAYKGYGYPPKACQGMGLEADSDVAGESDFDRAGDDGINKIRMVLPDVSEELQKKILHLAGGYSQPAEEQTRL